MATPVRPVPVEHRLEIEELGARYAFRCDTGLYDQVAELFAEGGIWDESVVGLPVCEGPDAINQASP
jgi:hypothetical protein